MGADLRKQMVDDVGLDDPVEEISADEAKVAVDGGEGALDVGPVVGVKVGELGVGVVEVGNGNYRHTRTRSVRAHREKMKKKHKEDLPSQWWTQK